MYEVNTTDAEGDLSGSLEDDDIPVMATVLDRMIPTPEVNNNYVNASFMLPRGNKYSIGKVIGLKRDVDGNSIGRENDTPILDTREYFVEFDDGEVSERMENMISESIYSACDDDGNDHFMMGLIVDCHNNDKPVVIDYKKVVHIVWNSMQWYTVGWQICVQWRYFSTSCQSLRYLKESHTVETE